MILHSKDSYLLGPFNMQNANKQLIGMISISYDLCKDSV